MSKNGNRKCSTGKKGYDSHRRAMMAVGWLADHSRRDNVPHRAYHCGRCDRWHLTSQPRSREQGPGTRFQESGN